MEPRRDSWRCLFLTARNSRPYQARKERQPPIFIFAPDRSALPLLTVLVTSESLFPATRQLAFHHRRNLHSVGSASLPPSDAAHNSSACIEGKLNSAIR